LLEVNSTESQRLSAREAAKPPEAKPLLLEVNPTERQRLSAREAAKPQISD